jgi:hypothetical protein
MTDKKSQFKASPFATIQKSGSVSVKLNEFLGSDAGKSQLKQMQAVREVAQRSLPDSSLAARTPK